MASWGMTMALGSADDTLGRLGALRGWCQITRRGRVWFDRGVNRKPDWDQLSSSEYTESVWWLSP